MVTPDPDTYAAPGTPAPDNECAKPVRVQLSRRKGWQMPENTVNVARPNKWGNEARIGFRDPLFGFVETRADAAAAFRMFVEREPELVEEAQQDLRGKNLACWCPLEDEHGNRVPCHADVLLEIANSTASEVPMRVITA